MKRDIIEIDEELCTGCGQCIPNCPEGALQVIDGKARLVSDLFCDGLGACVGYCPEDAMKVVKREAGPYDERKVMENIVKQGPNTIKAHLMHLKGHGADDYLNEAVSFLRENNYSVPELEERCACPGSQIREMKREKRIVSGELESSLEQWPVQFNLVSPNAPFLKGADLLIAADCTAFAYPNFHSKLLPGRKLFIGCPKFDDVDSYVEKLTEIYRRNDIKSTTVAIMEVPCCSGMFMAVKEAIEKSGKKIPLYRKVVHIDGGLEEQG